MYLVRRVDQGMRMVEHLRFLFHRSKTTALTRTSCQYLAVS